jgi:CheY-like chemotaxis protein
MSAGLPLILIADDDADDQFFLRRALEKADVANPIVTFNDGDDLLEFLQRRPDADARAEPCLLFLDLNMPRMTGFDVLTRLAGARRATGLKTVVVSSSTREDDIERAKALGASEYLVKFPTPATFGRIVAAALERSDLSQQSESPSPQNAA